MKRLVIIASTTLIIVACKNGSKDNVEKVDSANQAHIDSPATNTETVMTDEESSSFLVKAADGGMAQVQLGGLAREKAIDQKVRNFAALIVREHSAMNEEIKGLALKRNVQLPETISDVNRKKIDDLSARPRKEFDKAYTDLMAKDHEAAIDLFEKAGDKVHDTEVKNFINNSLPKMKTHLDSVRVIRRSLK